MSAVDEAGVMILRARASEAKAKANQAEVYAVYVKGTPQEELSPVALIVEGTLTALIVHEAKYERERANYLAAAVRRAEDALEGKA